MEIPLAGKLDVYYLFFYLYIFRGFIRFVVALSFREINYVFLNDVFVFLCIYCMYIVLIWRTNGKNIIILYCRTRVENLCDELNSMENNNRF